MKSLYAFLLLLALSAATASAQIAWQPIGPYGGNVTRVAADAGGALFAMADNGIYRSSNNGVTWSRVPDISVGATFVSFTIARNGTYFASTANAGVFRSTDLGLHWSEASVGLPQSFAWSIAANPAADEVLVATGPGVYRSSDNGLTWSLTGNERIARPVLFAPDGTAYVAVDSGVMISRDPARATWTWTDSTATPSPITGMVLVGDDTLWAGTAANGVYRSVDGGMTWASRNTGLSSMAIEAIDHGRAGELFVSTKDGGLHRSTDDGALWVRLNPTRVQFVASSMLRAPSGRLFVTSPKGIFFSDFDMIGADWSPSRTGIINSVPRTVIAAPDDRLYVMQFTGVFHATTVPAGAWSIVDLDIPPGTDASAMALDSSGALVATVNGVGLFRSVDQGATWQRFAETLPTRRPTAIAIGPFGRIFVGSDSGHVYRSTDAGGSWSDDSLFRGRASRINAIAVREETVFAGSEQNIAVSRDGGRRWESTGTLVRTYSIAVAPNGRVYAGSYLGRVYRSTDDGMSWEYSTTTPMAPLVAAVAVNARGDVLAGAQPGGVFLSRDGGVTFTPQQTGLLNPAITSIAVDNAGRAYVATYGGGVYVSTESTTGVRGEERTGGISLSLAPSPAAARAMIELGIERPARVLIELFDCTGERVLSLHDGAVDAGVHRFAIDASALPPGVYRVRALVDGASVVAPFIVVR